MTAPDVGIGLLRAGNEAVGHHVRMNDEIPPVPPDDDELLAQCDVWTFRGSGPGGQSVNTSDSAVRLRHRPTGITVVCRRERSQLLNKRECLARLRRRLEDLSKPETPRIPTRISRGAKQRRLDEKARLSEKKRERRPPADSD